MFIGAISRYPLYLFLEKKKDAVTIGANNSRVYVEV